ncbi:MAG: FtsW/RodA/SpoVE family cell cycle protein [Planctomycetota bacterium]
MSSEATPIEPGRPADFLRRAEWWVAVWAIVISAAGYLFIRSATYGFDNESLATKQVLFLGAGAAVVLAVLVTPYLKLTRYVWWIYAFSILFLVGLPFLGVRINGAQRWYRILGFGLQPSEFAKVAVILGLAAWFRYRPAQGLRNGLLVPLAIVSLPVLLILKQPDLSSSLVFWPVMLAVCYAAGASIRTLVAFVVVGVLALVLAYFTLMHDYQRARVDVWIDHFSWTKEQVLTDPEVKRQLRVHGYQPWQALIAIGSGGMFGQGYLQGTQSRFDFLPYRSGDYVFAVVCEELGMLGAIAILLAVFALCLAILGVAMRTREPFGRLVAVGIAAWIGAQTIMHVAVCCWFVPATGLPMPLVSHGGSSTLAAAIAIGLVLNISARRPWTLGSTGFR